MALVFDRTQWIAAPANDQKVEQWHDGNGVHLIVQRIGVDQDLRTHLGDEASLRKYYRDAYAEQGIGIVQCDLVTVSGVPAARTIGKKIAQAQPALYAGSLAIPLHDRSYVLSLYAQEGGVTGLRDTAVFSKLSIEGGAVALDEVTGRMVGWARDPYFPDFEGPCLRNLSEDEKYDAQFPEHPLSKVRARLLELSRSAKLEEHGKKKPWWKLF